MSVEGCESTSLLSGLFSGAHHQIPLLEVLYINWDWQGDETPIAVFADAPTLRYLSLTCLNPLPFKAPWRQLTCFQAYLVWFHQVIPIVALCPTLVTLSVYDLFVDYDPSIKHAKSTSIMSLSIGWLGDEYHDEEGEGDYHYDSVAWFLDCLTLPSLKSFTIIDDLRVVVEGSIPVNKLVSLIDRSLASWTSLAFKNPTISCTDFVSLLRHLPSLQTLSLTEFLYTGICNKPFADALSIIPSSEASSILVPQLRALRIKHEGPQQIFHTGFMAILQSRAQAKFPLRAVGVARVHPDGWAESKQIAEELIATGMEINLLLDGKLSRETSLHDNYFPHCLVCLNPVASTLPKSWHCDDRPGSRQG